MTLRDKIIDVVTPLFLQNTYKDLHMDDIAQELTMSKKTIYKVFLTKDKLFQAVRDNLFNYVANVLTKIDEGAENYVDLLYKLKNHFEKISDVEQQRKFIKQIANYDTKTLNKAINISTSSLYKISQQTTKRAIADGVLYEELNENVINRIFATNYVGIKLDNNYYKNKEDLEKLEKMWFYLHLRGVFNKKGRQMLEDYVKEHPEVL